MLKLQANEILTAVCKGIRDNNNEIKVAALTALYNALEFVKVNFEKEVERNYIMEVVCGSTMCPEVKVRISSLECLVRIADLYYDKLAPYMQRIFNVSISPLHMSLTLGRSPLKQSRRMKSMLPYKQ